MSNDRFTNKRPAFIVPSKPLIATDGSFKRENTPAKPTATLPALNMPTFGTPVVKEKKEKKEASSKEVCVKVIGSIAPTTIDPSDIVSDSEFIKRTRSSTYKSSKVHRSGENIVTPTIHDPEVKRLFWANGGKEVCPFTGKMFFESFDTLANAYDSLRNSKLAKLAGTKAEEYKRVRVLGHDMKVFIPCNTTFSEAQAERNRAMAEALRRSANEAWMAGLNQKAS